MSLRWRTDGIDQVLHLPWPKEAMIDRQDHNFRSGRDSFTIRLKHHGSCSQRPMHAFRPVVQGGSPHAMVDTDRRRDITSGLAEVAKSLRQINRWVVIVQS